MQLIIENAMPRNFFAPPYPIDQPKLPYPIGHAPQSPYPIDLAEQGKRKRGREEEGVLPTPTDQERGLLQPPCLLQAHPPHTPEALLPYPQPTYTNYPRQVIVINTIGFYCEMKEILKRY